MKYKEAIKLSLKVWIWLKHHPNKGKEDSPFWNELKSLSGDCPLCDHYGGSNYSIVENVPCDACELYRSRVCHTVRCDSLAFWQWRTSPLSHTILRKVAASKIVTVLKKEYKRLLKEENYNVVPCQCRIISVSSN